MLYDLGIRPRPGSLLETVLSLVSQRRRYQKYLESKLLVEAILAPHSQEKNGKRLAKTFDDFVSIVLPFAGDSTENTDETEQKVLRWWTSKKGFKVTPLSGAPAKAPAQIRSALKRGAEKVRMLEEDRRRGRLKRM